MKFEPFSLKQKNYAKGFQKYFVVEESLIVSIIHRERRMAARTMRERFRDILDPFRIPGDL